MKLKSKLGFVTLIFVVTAMITSCSLSKEVDMEKMYFFTSSEGGDIGLHGCYLSTPLKINPVTNSCTAVCLDPLCSKSLDCTLSKARERAVSGDSMFFVLNPSVNGESQDDHKKLCVYNMVNGNLYVLAVFENYPIFAAAYDNWLYYYDITTIEQAIDGKYQVEAALCRINGKSRKIEQLTKGDEFSSAYTFTYMSLPQIIGIDDNKIVWKFWDENSGKTEFYQTDLRNKNKKTIYSTTDDITNVTYSGGKIFFTKPIKTEAAEGTSKYEREKRDRENTLYSLEITTGEINEVCSDVAQYAVIGDRVYYTICQDEAPKIIWEMGHEFDWYGGRIYSVSINGENTILAAELENINLADFIDAKEIGDTAYLQMSFFEWSDNDFYKSGKEYSISQKTIILNCLTGEYSIAEWK